MRAATRSRDPTPVPTPDSKRRADLKRLAGEIESCRRCPRLVAWREAAAADPPRRFRGERYWARPLPGFGDPAAHMLVLGLAPAAHGGNRTARVFTGDRSGDWLYAALHRAGYANQPRSERRGDGLRLDGAWVTAVNRCPPPANRPTPGERDNCLPYLERELELLDGVRAIVALGGYAWDGALRALRALGHEAPRPKPRFAHGAEAKVGPYVLLGCFHPSQQNTFTGRLTEGMMEEIFGRARRAAKAAR